MSEVKMPVVMLHGKDKEVEQTTKCTVLMDGVWHKSDDFVAVVCKENGDAALYFNTDALTLGMALQMITRAYTNSLHSLSKADRQSVVDILGKEFDIGDDTDEEH